MRFGCAWSGFDSQHPDFNNLFMDNIQKFKIINKELKRLYPTIKIALNFSNIWELLVATILSAQTTDKKVNEITFKLFRKYRDINDYAKADAVEFEKDIHGVNYHKTKAKAIVSNAQILIDKFHSKVPKTMDELLTLKNVARKSANIVLSIGFNINEGLAVDTHVIRLSNLYGLTDKKDPKKIEQDLLKIIPEKERKDFQLRIVQYGRDYCPAKKHDHKNCPLVLALNKK